MSTIKTGYYIFIKSNLLQTFLTAESRREKAENRREDLVFDLTLRSSFQLVLPEGLCGPLRLIFLPQRNTKVSLRLTKDYPYCNLEINHSFHNTIAVAGNKIEGFLRFGEWKPVGNHILDFYLSRLHHFECRFHAINLTPYKLE